MEAETNARPVLARSGLDRDHRLRLDDSALAAASGSGARAIIVHGDRGLSNGGALALLALEDAPDGLRVWLGVTTDGDARIAIIVDDATAGRLGERGEFVTLRAAAGKLGETDMGMLAQAIALAAWHRDHQYSPLDGSLMQAENAGWVLRDASGNAHFPRTDPAVIVLVTDASNERILLGNNASWEPDRYSLLAGFVDPGESLEMTVAREVYEEAGVALTDVRYVASQPWPFPRSLMIGFCATALDPDAALADGIEIRHVRWFTRGELREADITLPGAASIARSMIDSWLAQ